MTKIKNTSDIAKVCHEVNKAICEAAGDFSQAPWEKAEQWQRDSAVKGVEFALANPHASADAQHNAWMQDKLNDGWVVGPVKSVSLREHPCLVPYADLPFEQRVKDHTFKAVVRALS
jgi:hypothetical protein